MGEKGTSRRLHDDTEHDQPLPAQESESLLKHVDELVEIAPQSGARRSWKSGVNNRRYFDLPPTAT
jgi:hypothetical protein